MELNKQNTQKIIRLFFIFMLIYFGFQRITTVMNGLSFAITLFKPFIVGAVIAFILNVPMTHIEHFFESHTKIKKGRRILAWFISLATVLAILALALFIVLPQLWEIGRASCRERV